MAPDEPNLLFLLMSVRVNKGKLLGPTTAGVCHSFHEFTMYVNTTNNVDNLETSFTQNLFENIISRLLNNLLPTDPHTKVQGRRYITLSSKFTVCIMEGEERM